MTSKSGLLADPPMFQVGNMGGISPATPGCHSKMRPDDHSEEQGDEIIG